MVTGNSVGKAWDGAGAGWTGTKVEGMGEICNTVNLSLSFLRAVSQLLPAVLPAGGPPHLARPLTACQASCQFT